MKNYELYTKDELAFFASIENGNYTPISKEELYKEKALTKQIAQNTIKRLTRKKSLNLRVFENDIKNIKALALEKGLPYQTLIASVIHQVATRQIKI